MEKTTKQNLKDFAEWYKNEFNIDLELEPELSDGSITEALLEQFQDEMKAQELCEERDERAIRKYCSLVGCDDESEITPETIEEWALKRTSCEENYDYNNLKELLCKRG